MNGKKAKQLRSIANGSDEIEYTQKIYKKFVKTVAGSRIDYTVYTQKLKDTCKRADYKSLKQKYNDNELYI